MKTEHLLGKVILAISSTTYSIEEKAVAIEHAISYQASLRNDVRNSLAILRESFPAGDINARIYNCAISHIDSKSVAINLSTNLTNTADAKEWAIQFLVNWQRGMTVDAGTMIGWFANAIETGRTFGRTEAAKRDGERALTAPIGDLLSDPSAERWANAFCENSSEPVALMRNWFACAISCGINEGMRQAAANQKIGVLLADYATQKPATDSRPFKGTKTVYAIPQSVCLEKVRKLIQESFMHPLAERMQNHLCFTELQMHNPSMDYLISECAKTTPDDIATQAWLVLGKQWKNVDLDKLEKEVLAAADKPIYGVDTPALPPVINRRKDIQDALLLIENHSPNQSTTEIAKKHFLARESLLPAVRVEDLLIDCAITSPTDISQSFWSTLQSVWAEHRRKSQTVPATDSRETAIAEARKMAEEIKVAESNPATDSTGYANGGVKQNINKIDYTIIPPDFLTALALIMMYGAVKYDRDNWKKVPPNEYVKATYRHLLAHLGGEFYDKESGLPHLTCVAVDALFAQSNLNPKMPELADVLSSAKKAKVKV